MLNSKLMMPPRDAASIHGDARLFYEGVDMLETEARFYHDNALASTVVAYIMPMRPKVYR